MSKPLPRLYEQYLTNRIMKQTLLILKRAPSARKSYFCNERASNANHYHSHVYDRNKTFSYVMNNRENFHTCPFAYKTHKHTSEAEHFSIHVSKNIAFGYRTHGFVRRINKYKEGKDAGGEKRKKKYSTEAKVRIKSNCFTILSKVTRFPKPCAWATCGTLQSHLWTCINGVLCVMRVSP